MDATPSPGLPTYDTPPVCRALFGVPSIVSLAIRLQSISYESCIVSAYHKARPSRAINEDVYYYYYYMAVDV